MKGLFSRTMTKLKYHVTLCHRVRLSLGLREYRWLYCINLLFTDKVKVSICLVSFISYPSRLFISVFLFSSGCFFFQSSIPPLISSSLGHPPMQCTILSNPRASPINFPQHIRTHHPGPVRHTLTVHPPLHPVIPSTQTATSLTTFSPFTIIKIPFHTTPLHPRMEVSPSMSLVNHWVSDRHHQGAPRAKSSHPIGSSSYLSARCVVVPSHRRLPYEPIFYPSHFTR
jgi:hypothetical protein